MGINNLLKTMIDCAIIIIYLILVLFSLLIFPLNIIFGIYCVLWIPGYNLLKLIKPKSNFIEKLGLAVILSIAIDNLIMFFYYLLLFDIVTTPENTAFFFNENLIIFIILSLSLFMILLNTIIEIRKSESGKAFNDKVRRDIEIDYKVISIYVGFVLSLIFMCISTLFSKVPNNSYSENRIAYSLAFTFFNRVPIIFYLFLVISLFCLINIIFFTKNHYFILFSISAFIYCLWILPYLQVANYFAWDSQFLSSIYNNYLIYGIKATSNYPFTIRIKTFSTIRYSTSLFTSILLVSATSLNINAVLWYIYPLIFVFIPFLFYSIFHKHSKETEKNNLTFMILITFLAILSPQFLKYPHTASTGVIGAIVFIILVVEFFELINNRESKFKIKNFFIIIFLYFFLCLTHFEESFYFLSLIFLYLIYFTFFEFRKSKSKHKLNSISSTSIKIKDKLNTESELKRVLFYIGTLLIILSIFFYITLEFFGNITYYFYKVVSQNSVLDYFFLSYLHSKVSLPLLAGNFQLNLYIIGLIVLGIILFIVFCYYLLFKNNSILLAINNGVAKFVKKLHDIIKKGVSLKYFLLMFYILLFAIILVIELYFFPFLQEEGLFLIIEIILNYSIMIFQSLLFVKGILYYKSNNKKQNFFLLSILTSSSLIAGLFITGNIDLSYYILNARFFTYFIFFNLVIIQNTYFKEFINKKKIYLILIACLLIILSIFYSLRKLAWG